MKRPTGKGLECVGNEILRHRSLNLRHQERGPVIGETKRGLSICFPALGVGSTPLSGPRSCEPFNVTKGIT